MEEEKRGVFSGVETSLCYGMDLIKFVLVCCHLCFLSLKLTIHCVELDIDQLFEGPFLPVAHQTLWLLGSRLIHLCLCRTLLLRSLRLVC